MGTWYTDVVFEDIPPHAVDVVATCVLRALVERKVILPEPTFCAFSADILAYPPGPEIEAFTGNPHRWLENSPGCGLEIVKGRSVFHDVFVETMRCPRCEKIGPVSDAWYDAVERWYEGNANAECICAYCGSASWFRAFTLDRPFGFGHLGCRFWHWVFADPKGTAKWFADLTASHVVVIHTKV